MDKFFADVTGISFERAVTFSSFSDIRDWVDSLRIKIPTLSLDSIPSIEPQIVEYDDWGWLYYGPLLLVQLSFLIAAWRARTIRFTQLLLCLGGTYWALVVYYVQYFERGTHIAFCDVKLSQCSHCLHHPIARLPGYFTLVPVESSANRSIADTSLLYYGLHVAYPLFVKVPVIGNWITHFGFLVSFVVALCCCYLGYCLTVEVGDPCPVYVCLLLTNIGHCKAMWGHLRNIVLKQGALTAKKQE